MIFKKINKYIYLSFLLLPLVITSCQTSTSTSSSVTTNLRILATSDLHGKFIPYDYKSNSVSTSGSVAQVVTKVKELRDSSTIVIDNGDTLSSNMAEIFTSDSWLNNYNHPMVDAMNMVNYDVVGYGNHEFDYGVSTLEKIYSKHTAKIICGNVFNEDGTTLLENTLPHIIINKSGIRVGIIGAVTPTITKRNKEELSGYVVKDPLETILASYNEIVSDSDIQILVAHMGEENESDIPNSGIFDISKNVPGLDLIIAGHDHKKIASKTLEGIPYIENLKYGRSIGQANITLRKVNNDAWEVFNTIVEVIELNKVEADNETVTKLATADEYAKNYINSTLATYNSDDLQLSSEIQGIPTSKIKPSLLTQLINEVQHQHVKKYIENKGEEKASINKTYLEYSSYEIVSATSIYNDKANISNTSEITRNDIFNLYPKDDIYIF